MSGIDDDTLHYDRVVVGGLMERQGITARIERGGEKLARLLTLRAEMDELIQTEQLELERAQAEAVAFHSRFEALTPEAKALKTREAMRLLFEVMSQHVDVGISPMYHEVCRKMDHICCQRANLLIIDLGLEFRSPEEIRRAILRRPMLGYYPGGGLHVRKLDRHAEQAVAAQLGDLSCLEASDEAIVEALEQSLPEITQIGLPHLQLTDVRVVEKRYPYPNSLIMYGRPTKEQIQKHMGNLVVSRPSWSRARFEKLVRTSDDSRIRIHALTGKSDVLFLLKLKPKPDPEPNVMTVLEYWRHWRDSA